MASIVIESILLFYACRPSLSVGGSDMVHFCIFIHGIIPRLIQLKMVNMLDLITFVFY